MKVIVTTTNSSKLVGDVLKVIVDSTEIRFELRGRENLVFVKDNYNDERFETVQNQLKGINVSNKAVAFINIAKGTVQMDGTDDAMALYNKLISDGNGGSSQQQPSAPLIDGKFTQAPQGNIAALDQKVLDSYTK